MVLDEPDSHLHPNNQRLLCGLLRRVAEERGTQILLTTHSRRVVDAMGGVTKFLWVGNGTVESAGADDEIGVPLDIGALDVKERATRPGTKVIVLTADENTRPLEALLESSGFVMDETVILPYYGISTIKQLRPLVRMISEISTDAKIVVQMDRDYLTDDEAKEWEKRVRRFGVEPFVTIRVDIESHFLEPRHLAAVNSGPSEVDFCCSIDTARLACKDISVQHYVNGRIYSDSRSDVKTRIRYGLTNRPGCVGQVLD